MTKERDAAKLCTDLADKIHALLHGQAEVVQGAIIADLTARWLAGHTPWVRDVVLKLHTEFVKKLIPVCEAMMFGPDGHPGEKGNGDAKAEV